MCAGDDKSCPEYESHRLRQSLALDQERRSFVKSAFATAGGLAARTTISYEDKDGRWHDERSAGTDRPETDVKG